MKNWFKNKWITASQFWTKEKSYSYAEILYSERRFITNGVSPREPEVQKR